MPTLLPFGTTTSLRPDVTLQSSSDSFIWIRCTNLSACWWPRFLTAPPRILLIASLPELLIISSITLYPMIGRCRELLVTNAGNAIFSEHTLGDVSLSSISIHPSNGIGVPLAVLRSRPSLQSSSWEIGRSGVCGRFWSTHVAFNIDTCAPVSHSTVVGTLLRRQSTVHCRPTRLVILVRCFGLTWQIKTLLAFTGLLTGEVDGNCGCGYTLSCGRNPAPYPWCARSLPFRHPRVKCSPEPHLKQWSQLEPVPASWHWWHPRRTWDRDGSNRGDCGCGVFCSDSWSAATWPFKEVSSAIPAFSSAISIISSPACSVFHRLRWRLRIYSGWAFDVSHLPD